jgi:hypothetical protein
VRRSVGQGGRAVVAMLMAICALSVVAETARADAWRPVPQGCVAGVAVTGCSTLRSGVGAHKVVISPDGRHAYGVAFNDDTLLIFDRDPATGVLTQRGAGGCLSEHGSGGACVKAKGLKQPMGIVISGDGRHVYVAARLSTAPNDNGLQTAGSVALFTRNPVTGDLSQPAGPSACLSHNTASGGSPIETGVCGKARGLTMVGTLAISPDGRNVYVAGHSLAVLDRDPATGVLTQPAGAAGCLQGRPEEGCAPVRGMTGETLQMAITPDGRSVYVPNIYGYLVVLDRDPSSGRLAQKPATSGCFAEYGGDGCALEARMIGARAVVASPDNRHVYVSSSRTMLVYARGGDGSLKLQSCIADPSISGCTPARNVSDLTYNAISPDGQAIVASNENSGHGFVAFERDAAGNLSQVAGPDGCVTADGNAWVRGAAVAGGCHAVTTQWGFGSPTFHDDSRFTVGSWSNGGSLTVFKRDLYPVCRDQDLKVVQNTPTPLTLACSDRNGDPLNYEITSGPRSGVLGAVDQGPGRVTLNPFAGFLGTDAVRYRAFAGGLSSNEATLRVSVVAPARAATPAPAAAEPSPAPAPAARPRTVTSPVTYNWAVRRSRLTLRQLLVRRLPAGATVTLTCSGKRCPFKTRTVARSDKATLNVLAAKSLKGRKTFRAGQTIDVRIAAPGMHTKVLRFKLRAGAVPKHRTYCVPLNAKRAQRSCA